MLFLLLRLLPPSYLFFVGHSGGHIRKGRKKKRWNEEEKDWERGRRGAWRGGGVWWRLKTVDERWPPSCCRSDTHSWNTQGTSPRKPPVWSTTHHQHNQSSVKTRQFFPSLWLLSRILSNPKDTKAPYLRAHSSDATDFLRDFLRQSLWLLTGSN